MNVTIIRDFGVLGREDVSAIGSARDAVEKAECVLFHLAAAPGAAMLGLILFALGSGKTSAILVGEGDGHWSRGVWLGSRAIPMFERCNEEDAVFLTKKLVEHGADGIRGTPFAGIWAREMAKCESPIEEKLLLHVLSECDMDAEVRSQVEAGRFRVDIAVSDHDSGWKLAVECDGHDFHERTKEQAQRDKSRDRALALDGWTVMRFTGSEIWRNARGCASQVLQMVRKHEANNE